MVLALLTASFVSIVCFIITAVMGFLISDRSGISQHFLFGFFTTFLVTLAQSMTMFYFIGTGKMVKDSVASHPAGQELVQRTKRFKAKVFPPSLWAMLFTMATMIVGGGVDTHVIPTFVHTILATVALYFNVVAFWREANCMIENNIVMQEVDRLLPPTATSPNAGGPTGGAPSAASLTGPSAGPPTA
jgi:hypothetical protein